MPAPAAWPGIIAPPCIIGVHIIIGMPPQDIIIGMPELIIFIIASMRSRIPSIGWPSAGIILQAMPSLVISI